MIQRNIGARHLFFFLMTNFVFARMSDFEGGLYGYDYPTSTQTLTELIQFYRKEKADNDF